MFRSNDRLGEPGPELAEKKAIRCESQVFGSVGCLETCQSTDTAEEVTQQERVSDEKATGAKLFTFEMNGDVRNGLPPGREQRRNETMQFEARYVGNGRRSECPKGADIGVCI